MKLKTITYSESRETVDARGLKNWKKFGVEIEVEGYESPEDAKGIAKGYVDKWHKESNPSNYFSEPQTLPVIDVKDR